MRAIADGGAGRPRQIVAFDQGLDLVLEIVGELEPVGAKKLDAVVGDRVVRRADHHARCRFFCDRDARDGGRRHDADRDHVASNRRDAGDDGRFEHRSRKTRVAPHDYRPVALDLVCEHRRPRAADRKRQLGREIVVRDAAHAVGPEIRSHSLSIVTLTDAGLKLCTTTFGAISSTGTAYVPGPRPERSSWALISAGFTAGSPR